MNMTLYDPGRSSLMGKLSSTIFNILQRTVTLQHGNTLSIHMGCQLNHFDYLRLVKFFREQ